MANYEVPPAVLLPYLPPKTEIDVFDNICYVSLVAFRFVDTKVKKISIPFHTNFEEINLRFYVRHRQNNEWKRGVVFIKEIVPRFAITFIANAFYQEKYQTMPTWSSASQLPESMSVTYRWGRRLVNELTVTASPQGQPITKGSEEEFITEHYWGYSRQRNNTTKEYKVEHPRWNVYPVTGYKIVCDFEKLYGNDFGFLQQSQPVSVLLA